MDQTLITATAGRALGSRPSRRLRAEGKLPAVIYGLGKDPVSIAVDYVELRDALKGEAGMNTVIELDIDGAAAETVIIRDVERDPLKRVVTHADFLRIDTSKQINVRVPIRLVGEPTAVLSEGGLIEQQLFELEVEVSPLNIPAEIEVDVSDMTLDARIGVGDLNLPDGVTTAVTEDVSVVSPVISRAAKMGLDEDELEGDEDAEAAADDDAEEGDGDDDSGEE